ncbi:hypothetical protein [Tropicimonas sp. IMCC6043]|uniref:hypothetical protein n=1 Tax=Tropicimonas sp. IMCC6043 TaxID=2510645 RepID=UPI00101C1819|nr:hypothetical protein [Tropicimonas sp. IMCC6043]
MTSLSLPSARKDEGCNNANSGVVRALPPCSDGRVLHFEGRYREGKLFKSEKIFSLDEAKLYIDHAGADLQVKVAKKPL